MKKIAIIIASFAILSGNSAFALGQGAQAGTDSSSNNFAWGIGLGGLAVLGTLTGVIAGTASQGSSFSH